MPKAEAAEDSGTEAKQFKVRWYCIAIALFQLTFIASGDCSRGTCYKQDPKGKIEGLLGSDALVVHC
jgi:hypothetical protein